MSARAIPAGLWPIAVNLNGAALNLDDVLSDVSIRHGGADPLTAADPASTQIILRGVTRAYSKAFRVGGALTINARVGASSLPRFTGTVSDARLEDDELTVIGVGRKSTLWRYTIGAGAWPAETWSLRVARAFAEAGLSSSLVCQVGAFNPTLAARAAQPVDLSSYLSTVSDDVGAVVCDLPDGRVLVQALNARTFAAPLELDPALVVYAPPWEQALVVENAVTVNYTGGATFTATDPASADLFGPFPASIDTELQNLADAQTRANDRLARRAYPRWIVSGAPLIAGYQTLSIGSTVILRELPDSAPYAAWQPVLEGWVDRITGDEWTMSLALSDPYLSGLSLPWSSAPGKWNTIDPAVAWRDANTPGDLVPL